MKSSSKNSQGNMNKKRATMLFNKKLLMVVAQLHKITKNVGQTWNSDDECCEVWDFLDVVVVLKIF